MNLKNCQQKNDVTICKYDESFGYILTSDYSLVREIWESLSFWVPGYQFMPAYKRGFFDGKIKLMDLNTRRFPIGLAQQIYVFCRNRGIPCQVENAVLDCFTRGPAEEEIERFIDGVSVHSRGEKIYPREDQRAAIIRAISSKRCVNICPTSFGKSLAITFECLWYVAKGLRCLIVVPTKDLVDQFANDIADYATKEDGSKEKWFPNIQRIYAGNTKELKEDTEICISTWQSLAKTEEGYMNQFDVIILDECHKGSAQVLQKLMNTATAVKYRTGWTGTLSNETINELQIKGIFGPVKTITTTRELMDKGIVAQLDIVVDRITYPVEISQEVALLDYNSEMSFIEKYGPREDHIMNIIESREKTGLVLCKHIEHEKRLFEKVKERFPDRTAILIHGGHFQVNAKKYKGMEDIKPIIERDESAIIIANYQIIGTGISIKNLNWMIFAAPTKSFITTIQGIGRILRVSKLKTKATLIDVVDDFSFKKKTAIHQNYALKHFAERFNIYNEAKFDYSVQTQYLAGESLLGDGAIFG